MNENLFIQAILIFLVACFCYSSSFFGSTMWDRPIIVSALVGLVLGDLKTGIIVGGTLELVFLGAVPIGASNPPDMTSGAIIGTAFVILSNQPVAASVVLAVPVATLVLMFTNFEMTFVLTWVAHLADKYAANGEYKKIDKITIIAAIANIVSVSLLVSVSFYLGVPAIKNIIEMVPNYIITGMDVAAGIIPAIGFAMLARMILSKELSAFLLAGFLLAAYLEVSVLGVALFGVVIALVVYFNDNKNKSSLNRLEAVENDNEF
ncbi:MAG: PTS sugar transporter subunit IIC [Erysipelotrichaceae bacterium]